jgi:hypothetical protein
MKIQRSLKVLTLAIIASGFAVTSFGAVDCDSAYQTCLKTPGHTGCQIAHKQCTDGQTVAPTPAIVPAIVPAARAVNPAMAAANSSNSCDTDYTTCMSKPGHTGCQKVHADCLANPPAQATPVVPAAAAPVVATTTTIYCLIKNKNETVDIKKATDCPSGAKSIPADQVAALREKIAAMNAQILQKRGIVNCLTIDKTTMKMAINQVPTNSCEGKIVAPEQMNNARKEMNEYNSKPHSVPTGTIVTNVTTKTTTNLSLLAKQKRCQSMYDNCQVQNANNEKALEGCKKKFGICMEIDKK